MNRKPQPPTPSANPLQQMAELLELGRKILREAEVESTTGARVHHLPMAQLRNNPVLWAAYMRGWDDRTALFKQVIQTHITPDGRLTRRLATWQTGTTVAAKQRTLMAVTDPHPSTGVSQPNGWWEQTHPTTGLGPLDSIPLLSPPSPTAHRPPSTLPATTELPADAGSHPAEQEGNPTSVYAE